MKPRLFIGSARESINIAYAAQQNLHYTAEVTVWDQGIFQLSVPALESLLEVLPTFDFGLFVFSPDDIVTIRGEKNSAVRDNVIFELGLFVGALGRTRCFILIPDGTHDLRIPTDLIGMTPATYETDRSDGSLQAATAPACHTIRTTIERTGLRLERLEALKQGSKTQDASDEEELQPEVSPMMHHKSAEADESEATAWPVAMLNKDFPRAAELLSNQLLATDNEVKPRRATAYGAARHWPFAGGASHPTLDQRGSSSPLETPGVGGTSPLRTPTAIPPHRKRWGILARSR